MDSFDLPDFRLQNCLTRSQLSVSVIIKETIDTTAPMVFSDLKLGTVVLWRLLLFSALIWMWKETTRTFFKPLCQLIMLDVEKSWKCPMLHAAEFENFYHQVIKNLRWNEYHRLFHKHVFLSTWNEGSFEQIRKISNLKKICENLLKIVFFEETLLSSQKVSAANLEGGKHPEMVDFLVIFWFFS